MSLTAKIPRPIRARLRAEVNEAKKVWIRWFRAYGAAELRSALAALGAGPGSTVMLHSSHPDGSGFLGSIEDLTEAFIAQLGAEGTLLMVSLPYRTSSLQYLRSLKQFDVRRTPSMMGLVSEYFRLRPGVVRSLHPTHPVLAQGARAEWFVADHEACRYPCGPGTPFDKLLQADGIVVFFNVPFATFTFFHHLEHRVSPTLPFPLYTDTPFEVPVIDRSGRPGLVTTYAFSEEAIRRRRFQVLEDELWRRRLIAQRRVGSTRLLAIRVGEAVACVEQMWNSGQYFYDMSPATAVRPQKEAT